MKTYLITGGAGFIGSNFIQFILNKYDNIKILSLDKLTYAGNLENLKNIQNDRRYEFINGDICDKAIVEKIFTENNIDYVANFAAESHVDKSIREPEVFVKANVLGTVNLLNVTRNAWEESGSFKNGRKYIQVSTDEVYGTLDEIGLFAETTPIDPHSPYSASKASADLMVQAYYDTYKLPINITRCSNNYGPYQFPEKLIPLIICNCINHNKLPIYGDGMNIRDWLFVEDHCRAIDLVINSGRVGEIYNIGGCNERTNIQIVKTILEYLNKNIDGSINESLIEYVEDRKGHDRRYAIDPTKISKELGWQPKTSFEEGIIKTIIWYLDNKKWLENILSGEYQNYNKVIYENK